MADNNKYPDGIRVFKKHDKAPDFVIGNVVISLNKLVAYCKSNPEFLTEYEGEKQLKIVIKDGKKGYYAEVDTYKKEATGIGKNDESLPF